MRGRCGFEIALDERRQQCASWLADEHDDIYDRPPVDDVEVFDDLSCEDGRWQCPRTATDGDRCVLHAESAADADIHAEIEAALRGEYDADDFAVDVPGGDYRTLASRFLGVELETLDLRGWQQSAPAGTALDLRCAEIGTLQFGEASLDGPLRLAGATVGSIEGSQATLRGSLSARYVTVERGVTVDHASVDGRVDFRFADLGGDVSLRHTDAASRFDLGFSRVAGAIDAFGGTCGGRFTLKEATADRVAAGDVAVSGPDPDSDIPGLQFRGLTTDGSVSIEGTACDGQLIGYRMDIGGDVDAAGASITQGVSLGTRSGTKLREAAIAGSLSFRGADVGGNCKIVGRGQPGSTLRVGGEVDLSKATFEDLTVAPELTHDDLSVVDCRGATIRAGVLAQPTDATPVVYDLEHAELGAVEIEPGSSTAPESLWLNQTTFAGFKFVNGARRDFERADWELIDDDPDRRAAVAFARVFGDAAGYARDFAAVCVAQPETCEWLLETEPPSDPQRLAERVFADVGEKTIERVAKNGPENRDQLGPELFERERYRVGAVTLLARCLHPIQADDAEGEGLAATLVEGAGEELRALARDTGDSENTPDDGVSDVSALRDDIAAALAEETDVARTLEQQELTYINARKGADDVGDSTTAGHLFVNERRVRRQIHWREGDYRRGAANLIFYLVAGYGERPWRAFGASLGMIVGFAGVYTLLWRHYAAFSSPTYAGFDGAMLLSSASFTAFVLGGTSVEPKLIRFVANFEALLGAFMIALFVFTLTRSLHR